MSATLVPNPDGLAARSSLVAVLQSVRSLNAQRRRWRSLGGLLCGLAAVLLTTLFAAAVDSAFPLSLNPRRFFFLFLLAGLLATFALAGWRWLQRRSVLAEAMEVQSRAGLTDNSIVTAVERSENAAVPHYLLARLHTQAVRSLNAIEPRRISSRKAAGLGCMATAAGVLGLITFAWLAPTAFAREFDRLILLRPDRDQSGLNLSASNAFGIRSAQPSIRNLQVRVVPPAYSGLPTVEVPDGATVRALAGSRIELALETSGPVTGATFEFAGLTQPFRNAGGGEYAASFIVEKSGALGVRAAADTPVPVTPAVRAIEVFPDAVPEVHLTEPSTDKLWTTIPSAPVPVHWAARDDLGLGQATLKYIKSRGSGDAATFVNGELPFGVVARNSATEWSGAASVDLRRIQMQAGDTLVIWVEARDRRPTGDGVGKSGSIALALAAPELAKIALDGLGPTELRKFLLSQRIILQHTETLHRERVRLAQPEVSRRANDIAADQREFRGSFDGFINNEGLAGGGQLVEPNATGKAPDPGAVDERVQELAAERNEIHKHGIPEPPQNAPAKVRDLVLAINAMWDAEEALADTDTQRAIGHMRNALERLKRAQAAERYIPPVKAITQPVDLKRRYSGELAEIKTRLETLKRRPEPGSERGLRLALGESYAALADLNAALTAPVAGRPALVNWARGRISSAAQQLTGASGDHVVTVATVLGQLHIVESELARINSQGSAAEYSARVEKPLNLLLRSTAELFAIVEARVNSATGTDAPGLPTSGARSAEYFRRLH
jgi:hypothetical protein